MKSAVKNLLIVPILDVITGIFSNWKYMLIYEVRLDCGADY